MFASFDFDVIRRSLGYLFLDGMTFTLTLTGCWRAAASCSARCSRMMRLSALAAAVGRAGGLRQPDALAAAGAGDLLVLFPGALYRAVADRRVAARSAVGAFASSLITFSLFEAAYFSEIMRAGIQSISRGQVAAGYALGLNYWQAMGYIVLPQAFRNMLPVLLTQTIILFQDTSLVYVLSITDFLGAASKVAQRDGRLVEMYLFAALVYFVDSFVASFGVRRLQQRIANRPLARAGHDRDPTSASGTGRVPGPEGLHHPGRQGRGGGGVRAVGLRQVDADQDA